MAKPPREYRLTPLPESKQGFRDRLTALGKWDLAKSFRETLKKQMIAEGWKQEWAIHEAWRQTMGCYPTKNPRKYVSKGRREVREMSEEEARELSEECPDILPLEVAEELDRRGKVDFVVEVGWVKDNMLDPRIQPLDAPSKGAWTIMAHVRSDPKHRAKFVDQCFTHLIKREDKGEDESEAREQQASKKHADEVLSVLKGVK